MGVSFDHCRTGCEFTAGVGVKLYKAGVSVNLPIEYKVVYISQKERRKKNARECTCAVTCIRGKRKKTSVAISMHIERIFHSWNTPKFLQFSLVSFGF